jgi:hypothetical protein
MIRMKALRQFRGRPSEGRNGLVKPGREFSVADQRRADDLERSGLAVPAQLVLPVAAGAPAPAPASTGAETPLTLLRESPAADDAGTGTDSGTGAEPAADQGPLAGGQTGETDAAASAAASSSPADLPLLPLEPSSMGPEADAEPSPSMRAGGSRRGRTSSTPATEDGGATDPASPASLD